jgi:phage-related minor tail protein
LAKAGVLAAGAAGVGGLFVTLKAGISEFTQSTKVAAQTAAVIKSTGGAANVTAKHVDSLATSIMKYSGIDDEAIKSGENMLLTFKNIRNEAGKGNDIFDQSTKILTDMSVALGGDASKNAIRLGKALNDPVKGVTALTKVGVTFSDAQKKTIKSMVDMGDTRARRSSS